MRNLSTYIEYTLMTQHYVFVPGIGGFMLRDVDASYANGKYVPSHREVRFNRFLTNDDGMLANTYMESEGITYDEAITQIRIEVAKINSHIRRHKSYELGNLGILSYDSDHCLVVKYPKHFPLDPDCYGLEPLSIHPWTEREKHSQQYVFRPKADVVAIPKYWLQRAAAVLIIIACLFANTFISPGDKSNKTTNASMFDTEILFGNAVPNVASVADLDNEEAVIADVTSEEFDVVGQEPAVEAMNTFVVPESCSNKTASDEIPIQRTVVNNNGSNERIFFIIIASCSTLADAQRAAKKKLAEGYGNIGIIEKDGRFRLYLKSFAIRAEGESYLDEVRVSTPFQTAWLLPVRQGTLLSYNQKNIDNDQLSMELSHPNKRTERDQGSINS